MSSDPRTEIRAAAEAVGLDVALDELEAIGAAIRRFRSVYDPAERTNWHGEIRRLDSVGLGAARDAAIAAMWAMIGTEVEREEARAESRDLRQQLIQLQNDLAASGRTSRNLADGLADARRTLDEQRAGVEDVAARIERWCRGDEPLPGVSSTLLAKWWRDLRAALDGHPLAGVGGASPPSLLAASRPSPDTTRRYGQCDDTCTVDCGHCKGNGPPHAHCSSCHRPVPHNLVEQAACPSPAVDPADRGQS